MAGLSTSGSISLGCALVAGRKRVPRPAAGITALVTGVDTPQVWTKVPISASRPRGRPNTEPDPVNQTGVLEALKSIRELAEDLFADALERSYGKGMKVGTN